MLSRFKLIHILIAGFGLLMASSLYIANLGYSSTSSVKKSLDHISGDAWDTADGAMEVTIGVETQLLSIEHYLNSDDNPKYLKQLKAAQNHEAEEFQTMIKAGLVDQQTIDKVSQNSALYKDLTKELIINYQAFIKTENIRHTQYEEFLDALDEIEILEERLVAGFSKTPNKTTSWNTGLGTAWTVADSMMELRISLLSRGNHYQSLLKTKDFNKYTPLINEPWSTIEEIMKELGLHRSKSFFDALNKEKIKHGKYQGLSFSQMMKVAIADHKSSFDQATIALKALNNSYEKYQAQAEALLTNVSEIQVEVEGSIEQVLSTTDETYNAIVMQIMTGVILAVILAIVISTVLVRIILKNISNARNLAQSISSGNLDNIIDHNPTTEFGTLMMELNNMQTSLKTAQEDMKTRLKENRRIVDALDNSSANIMITDPKGTIVFANKNIKTFMDNNKTHLTEKVKNLDLENLKDPELDLFNLLGISLSQDHQTITLNSSTIEVDSLAISSETNEIIGYFTEWKDVTNTQAIQHQLNKLISEASTGNLSHRIETTEITGFLKELGDGINDMMDHIHHAMKDFIKTSKKLSEGDFSDTIHTNVDGDLKELKDTLNLAIGNISQLLNDISGTSNQVNDSANHILDSSLHVSEETSANAAAVEQTSASLEQMTSTLQQSSEYIKQVNNNASTAVSQAKESSEIVEKSVDAMHEVQEVSQKIYGITNLIDAIAFQTNLLALNAAVEAARAGEHGRGFAVVAGEVRSLAQKSADAAKDIKLLVTEVNEKVERGTNLVETTNTSLNEIIAEIQTVGEMIEEVTKSSIEQESGINQVSSAVNSVDHATQKTAVMVDDTSKTAEDLSQMMQQLREKLHKFKLVAPNREKLTKPE